MPELGTELEVKRGLHISGEFKFEQIIPLGKAQNIFAEFTRVAISLNSIEPMKTLVLTSMGGGEFDLSITNVALKSVAGVLNVSNGYSLALSTDTWTIKAHEMIKILIDAMLALADTHSLYYIEIFWAGYEPEEI